MRCQELSVAPVSVLCGGRTKRDRGRDTCQAGENPESRRCSGQRHWVRGGGGGLEQRITWEVQLSGLMTVEEEERGTSDDTQASRLNPGVAVGTSKGTDSGEGDELGGDILEGGI